MKFIKAKPISYGGVRPRKDVKYIVIHYTAGDGDTAENCANYFKNVNTRTAGAHFFIGQNGTIIKSIALNKIAWSVGGGKYTDCKTTGGGKLYGVANNTNSVSIELCDNLNYDPSPAQIKAVKKCIRYIRTYCPNAKTVIRHFDVTGKHCPARMMNDKKWKCFLKLINESEG